MDNKLKPVMSDEFTFVPQKAGIEIYVSLGIMLIVAVALMAANTTIEGGFDIFWVIYPVVLAAALGFMFPQIRYQQRVSKYKEYLRKQSRQTLIEALKEGQGHDDKSRVVIEQVLSEYETQSKPDTSE